MNELTCPVCGYDRLEFPPRDYSICACCGTEFGYDDRVLTHDQLRAEWINHGCQWFDIDEPRPADWNAYDQLLNAGLIPGPRAKAVNAATTISRNNVLHIGHGVKLHFGNALELQLV